MNALIALPVVLFALTFILFYAGFADDKVLREGMDEGGWVYLVLLVPIDFAMGVRIAHDNHTSGYVGFAGAALILAAFYKLCRFIAKRRSRESVGA